MIKYGLIYVNSKLLVRDVFGNAILFNDCPDPADKSKYSARLLTPEDQQSLFDEGVDKDNFKNN